MRFARAVIHLRKGRTSLPHADSSLPQSFLLIPITDRAHEWAAEHIS